MRQWGDVGFISPAVSADRITFRRPAVKIVIAFPLELFFLHADDVKGMLIFGVGVLAILPQHGPLSLDLFEPVYLFRDPIPLNSCGPIANR